jgi:membrane-bound lytic murein transglycosylase D
MIERIFREEGLPQDLIYLAQAESSFKPTALSRARARGMWQFIASRGREYGLQVGWWVDERQDPEKATRAAARHLRDLYEEFGDWHLAMAAYNTGPAGVARAIERTGYADFWELHKRNVLPRETKNYVPIILALTIIAKNQDKYGVQVQPEAPVETDVVKPGHPIDLRLVAETVDVSVETLKQLNPALLRTVTPRDPEFELHLPAGTAERFFAEIAEIPQEKWVLWRRHRVEEGETLSAIASKYRVTTTAIAQVNGIDTRSVLSVGDRLIIPSTTASNVAGRMVRYRVRRGDTLSEIARQHDVSVDDLRRWNGLRGSRVARGAVLKVYPGGRASAVTQTARRQTKGKEGSDSAELVAAGRGPDGTITHRVKPGETLWSIARAYRTTVEALRSANEFLISRQLKAGDMLVILLP